MTEPVSSSDSANPQTNGGTEGGAGGELGESADKPPHGSHSAIPLPPKDAGNYEHKEPGHTYGSLKKLVLASAEVVHAYTGPTTNGHGLELTSIKPQLPHLPLHPAKLEHPPHGQKSNTNGSASTASSPTMSPSASDSDWGTNSAPSTRPNSQAPSRAQSRAPSMSAGVAGGKLQMTLNSLDAAATTTGTPTTAKPSKPTPQPLAGTKSSSSITPTATGKDKDKHRFPSHSTPASPLIQPATPGGSESSFFGNTLRPKAPSVVSHDGDKHKFTLKDLLPSTPKLSRKSSQRSTASSTGRRSDTDRESLHDGHGHHEEKEKKGKSSGGGSGYAKSNASDKTSSLTQKYGVCQKLPLGKGATSVVRLAHKWDRSEEKLYAVKEFRKRRKNESEKEYVKKLTAEFCISSTLHHINVVETVDLVQDEAHNWCEVMEYCPGGDLYAAIKKGGMSPSEVECCFKQILLGVSYLHSQGVAHRDLKPENLFFDAHGHLKIGDYGASTVYRLPWEEKIHMSSGLCGSEPYIAPEQFLSKPYDARLVDIWACGVVYYCLHFSELPWRAASATDPMYGVYAAACSEATGAVAKDKDKEKEKDHKDKDKDHANANAASGTGTNTTTSHTAPHTAASTTPVNTTFPQTINNLSPRACRPLIRRMLEPNVKERANIEEVIAHPWIEGIEVCYAVSNPKHFHVNAKALANALARA